MKKTLIVLVSVLTLTAASAFAQTYPNSTTLSAAITATQTSFRVVSATGVAADGGLIIDNEYMGVVSVSGTLVTVTRVNRPAIHGSGTAVTVFSAAARAQSLLSGGAAEPLRSGQCSASTSSSAATALAPSLTGVSYLPIVNIVTGDFYMCRRVTGGLWKWVKLNTQGFNSIDGSVWVAWP